MGHVGEIDNWPISYDDAHDPKYGEPYTVPLLIASEETLKDYGRLVYDFEAEEVWMTPWPTSGWRPLCPNTGTGAAVVEGDFEHVWEGDRIRSINTACGWNYISGVLPKGVSPSDRTYVLTREANYHGDGGQVFCPKKKEPFIALLAPAKVGDNVKLEDFRAFYFDGSFGVQIYAGTWHQPVYPVSDTLSVYNKQGSVHACVQVDTVDEFGKYLRIPLKKEFAEAQ